MKKSIVFALPLLIYGLSAAAQKIDASKVPAAVKESFAKKYPGKKANWENEKGEFEAGFTDKGRTMSVLFTADGTLTETEVDIQQSALPAPVLAYIKQHYKAAAIREAAKITKADGTITYEAEVNKTDILFDEKGNFLKEVKD